jgi:hypothetical protein
MAGRQASCCLMKQRRQRHRRLLFSIAKQAPTNMKRHMASSQLRSNRHPVSLLARFATGTCVSQNPHACGTRILPVHSICKIGRSHELTCSPQAN